MTTELGMNRPEVPAKEDAAPAITAGNALRPVRYCHDKLRINMGVKMRKTNFLILLFGLLFIIGCTQQGAQTKPSDQNAPSTTGETTQASQGELKEFTM